MPARIWIRSQPDEGGTTWPKVFCWSRFDYTNAHEDEFHDWYDLEHVPERQRVPGFGLCERWISVANPKQAVATYDLDSLAVLKSEPYLAIALREPVGLVEAGRPDVHAADPLRRRADAAGRRRQSRRRRRLAGERDERGARTRGRIQRVVRPRAHPGARRGSRRAVGAAVQGSEGHASLSGAVSSEDAGGGGGRGLEGRGGVTLDRAAAAAFPRPSADPVTPVCA